MRRFSILIVVAVAVAACTGGSGTTPDAVANSSPPPSERVPAEDGVRVEIISLDHAPIRPFTEAALGIAGSYGDEVTVVVYDFDTPEGEAFAEEKGLTEHTPIAILIDGRYEFDVDGRAVAFLNFPQGEGTGVVAEGTWTLDDLRTLLDRATG
jgi:hypothetical protein